MTRQTISIQNYRTSEELRRAHPEVRSWICIHHAPRGQSEETQMAGLKKAMIHRSQWHQVVFVYQVGDFFWTPATQKPLCICLQYIGDNGPCPVPSHNPEGDHAQA